MVHKFDILELGWSLPEWRSLLCVASWLVRILQIRVKCAKYENTLAYFVQVEVTEYKVI